MLSRRFLPLIVILLVLVFGCRRPMALTPRGEITNLPLTTESIAAVATERAPVTQSLQIDVNLLAKASGYPLRIPFTLYVQWNDPQYVRVRLQREGISLIDIHQRGNQLSVLLNKLEVRFDGPVEDLAPEIVGVFPFHDLSILSRIPLIDASLAEEATGLNIIDSPGGAWKSHLMLRGADARSETWALNPATGTVEGLALPLDLAEDETWLLLTLESYEEVHTGVRGGEPTHVLPVDFTLSQVDHPWRRFFRGEKWVMEGHIRRHILDRGLGPQSYEPRATPGWQSLPLRDFIGLPYAALSGD